MGGDSMKMICNQIVFGFIFFISLTAIGTHESHANQNQVDKTQIASKMTGMSIPFIANEGQMDEQVSYYANTFGGTVFVTNQGEIVYSLPKRDDQQFDDLSEPLTPSVIETKTQGVALKETFVGGKTHSVKGEGEAVTRVSYFKGKDRSKWRNNIATYQVVNLGELYQGIDLKLRAYGNNLEKLFFVDPGASPDRIRVRLNGAKGLKVNHAGELVVDTELGKVTFTRPVAYQEKEGQTGSSSRIPVEVAYIVKGNEYGFQVGDYDPDKELVIDPLLASTFLGGDDHDYARSIVLDNDGNVYVTGETESIDFPTTPGAYDESYNGFSLSSADAFIAKLDSNLGTLLASTFLGGTSLDGGKSITLDADGNVYVIGGTHSLDFPTTPGAYNESHNGGYRDAFISKLDNNLTTLLASTFLGGSDSTWDTGVSITLDTDGNVYVTGRTASSDFPTTPGAYDESYNGGFSDAFISKLDSNLSMLLASTFLGGNDSDQPLFITLDADGNVYVTGSTQSFDFPTTPGAYDENHNGDFTDSFIAKLDSNLSTLLASTFLGGDDYDHARSITFDAVGNVYVIGSTQSLDFPTTPGAYDESHNGGTDDYDTFIAKLDSNLSTLLASTFLGGDDEDNGRSITLDAVGNVYVTGHTLSSDFPTTSGAYDESYDWSWEVYISRLDADLSEINAIEDVGSVLEHALFVNYPNPFHFNTTIQYSLTKTTHVTLKIFNTAGQLVRILVNGYQSPGSQSILWDGKDDTGEDVSSGLYIYKIRVDGDVLNQKMLLLR